MADAIAFDILVEARASGIRVYGDCHGKCSVVIKGNDTGLVGFWQGQRTDKQGGNLIHLIEVAEGVTHGEAVRIAKSRYLGIGDEYSERDKEKYEKRKAEAQRRAFVRKQDGDREAVEKENKVKEIWSKCLPIKGTLADKYLTNRVCAYDWPTSLRFHPQLYCEATRKTHPALVAAVQNVDRKMTAIWRIF